MKSAYDRATRALQFLEQHRLDPGSINYTLALTYVSDANEALTREINRATEGGVRLPAERAAGLAATYLGKASLPADDDDRRRVLSSAENLEDLARETQTITRTAADELGRAAEKTGDSQSVLASLVERLGVIQQDLSTIKQDIADINLRLGDGGETSGAGVMPADSLGLYDRQTMEPFLQSLAENLQGYVLAMFALDDLELINDRFGRSVGDNVLKALSATLTQIFEGQRIVRWNGNEFIVVLPASAPSNVRLLAEEARTHMETRRLRLRGTGELIGTVTLSAGIAPGKLAPYESVIELARRNVSLAVGAGGNTVKG